MDRGTVFYSWQTDSPPRVNRNLIEKALETAIEGTNAALHLTLALDQDLRGEGGSPLIGETVKAKIERAMAFVADVTIVAKRATAGGLVNSNVAVEWGWAGAALGNDGLIGVMNTASGDPQELPVDIHPHLVPVRYALPAAADDDQRRHARDVLAERLTQALTLSIFQRFFRGLHPEAPRIVEHLVRSAGDRLEAVQYAAEDLAAATGATEEAALAVMEDLNRAGLVTTEDAGYLGSGFMVRLLPSLFAHFDPLYMGWNADRDARQLARETHAARLVQCGRARGRATVVGAADEPGDLAFAAGFGRLGIGRERLPILPSAAQAQ